MSEHGDDCRITYLAQREVGHDLWLTTARVSDSEQARNHIRTHRPGSDDHWRLVKVHTCTTVTVLESTKET